MSETGQPVRKRRRLRWVIALVVLLLVGAGVMDLLEGPHMHASRPLPSLPPGSLAENLQRLEGAVPGQSSWPLIQEVLYELVPPDRSGLPHAGSTEEQRQEYQQYLEDNRTLLPRLREAGARSRYGQPMGVLQYWEERRDFLQSRADATGVQEAEQRLADIHADPGDALAPHMTVIAKLLDLRNLVNLLVLSAREAAAQDRPMDAVADLEAALGLGRQLSHRPVMVEQSIGSALEWIVQPEFRTLVMQRVGQWSEEDLGRLRASPLLEVPPRRALSDLVQGEFWWQLGIVEYAFQDGAVSPGTLKALFGGGSDRSWSLENLRLTLHAGREDTLRMMGAVHDDLLGLEAMAPARRQDYEIPESVLPLGVLGRSRYALVHMLVGPSIYAGFLSFQADRRMNAEASRTVVALVRYRTAVGEWPETLEELVAEFDHEEMPMDAVSLEALIYRRTAGKPYLYGVGRDGADNGTTGDDQVFLPVNRSPR